MIDLYSDDRDGNPYAYYEEDMSVKLTYHSGEGPSHQEPRTPMTIHLDRFHFFAILPKTYQLIVMRNYCELVVNDRTTEAVIPREEASDSVKIKSNHITIINENGRKYKFRMKSESFGEIKRARLALWYRETLPTDPLTAYRAVRDLMFDHFFASLSSTVLRICFLWVYMLIIIIIPSISRNPDYTTGVWFVLAYAIYYAAIAGVILTNRRAVFSSPMLIFLVLPLVGMFLICLIFPASLILAIFLVMPSFWMGFKILAFRGAVRKLREVNAEILNSPQAGV